MSEESPCVGICEIDESGYCSGCGRSAEEIFGEAPPAADDVVEAAAAAASSVE